MTKERRKIAEMAKEIAHLRVCRDMLVKDFEAANKKVITLMGVNATQKAEMDKTATLWAKIECSRIGRLMLGGKRHVLPIEEDEPYYLEVYRTIRQNAKRRGKWTTMCEADYHAAFERWSDRQSVKER